ncbi:MULTISPECIES: hypothetical protein [unclassified Janthinobacterium]|uniref:AbiTii domain-containing protein n=1 Tax=unclassified Janthinobacterium TaxID=2610881 RepID=UPI0024753496|nr:hypothetical protein [Janthinobacterium sp. CG_23.4]MDH6157110.1 hypothetical protein [Janthinobacterium sp. CG_23.4]
MTKSVVIELQELASNGDNSIGDLLRKTLMIATKLGLADMRQWALSELNGYKEVSRKNLPAYRVIHGEIKVHNPMNGLIPFQVPPDWHDAISRIEVSESLESILQLTNSTKYGKKGTIAYHFSPEIEKKLMDAQQGNLQLRPLRTVGVNQLMAILSAVRTRILEWALTLESDGILGEGLLFSERERQAAMHNISGQNFQGILGNVDGGSSVNQTNSQQITAADFSSLARHLTQNGVSQDDVKELECAVREDPKPSTPDEFGPKVSNWIGKMVGKAAGGGWQIGIATAGGFLANALGKFYGSA